ncbi:MAG: tryptophan-rich sensory protein, partial [Senegalia sp. (in: firmicutes)]
MKTWIKVSVIITYIAMIVTNALANILPINGLTTGEVSDSFENLFAPAGLTFSIWGLIYLLLGLYSLYQAGLFRDNNRRAKLLNSIGIIFSISSIANAAWIFSWHYKVLSLSILLMLVILISLITIVKKINKEKLFMKEKLFISLPFSIYFGWITVATIANITAFLVDIGWNQFGLSEVFWTIT